MSKFTTRKVEDIKARQTVEELFTNGLSVLDMFEKELEGTTYKSELNTLKKYIEHFANGNSVGSRVLYLKGVTDGVTEYEFKSKHVRIYVIEYGKKKSYYSLALKSTFGAVIIFQRFEISKTNFSNPK